MGQTWMTGLSVLDKGWAAAPQSSHFTDEAGEAQRGRRTPLGNTCFSHHSTHPPLTASEGRAWRHAGVTLSSRNSWA